MTTIYEYLKADHDKIKVLMQSIEDLGKDESQKRTELFNKIKSLLILHSKAEEISFYKPLKRYDETKEAVEHGKEEHEEVETLLQELTDASLAGAAWFQKFKKLKAAVEHHVKEEETEIFKKAHHVLNKSEESSMATEMKSEKCKKQEDLEIEPRD